MKTSFDYMDSGFACFDDWNGHVIRYRPHADPLSLLFSPSWLSLPPSLLSSQLLCSSLICFSLLASMSSNGKNQKHSSTSATSPCSYSDFLQRASNSWRPRKLAHSTPLHHTAAALHPDQNFTALAISSLATTFHSSPLTSLISSSR